jgi:hypothetical protein
MKNIYKSIYLLLLFAMVSCSDDPSEPTSKLARGFWESKFVVNDTIHDLYFYINVDCSSLRGAVGFYSKYLADEPSVIIQKEATWLYGTFENPDLATGFYKYNDPLGDKFGVFEGELNSPSGRRDSIIGKFYPANSPDGEFIEIVLTKTEKR